VRQSAARNKKSEKIMRTKLLAAILAGGCLLGLQAPAFAFFLPSNAAGGASGQAPSNEQRSAPRQHQDNGNVPAPPQNEDE